MVIDRMVDVFFIFDIALNFRTAYHKPDGTFEVDYIKIRNRYLVSWFPVDLIASIPFDIFLSDSAGASLALAKMPRLLRSFRLLKMLDKLTAARGLRVRARAAAQLAARSQPRTAAHTQHTSSGRMRACKTLRSPSGSRVRPSTARAVPDAFGAHFLPRLHPLRRLLLVAHRHLAGRGGMAVPGRGEHYRPRGRPRSLARPHRRPRRRPRRRRCCRLPLLASLPSHRWR
jgi:hypothetical protein